MMTRLMVGFLSLLAMTIALGGFAIFELANVNQVSTDMEVSHLPKVRATMDMNTNTSDFRVAELQHVASGAAADKKRYDTAMAAVLNVFEANRAEYVQLIDSADERALYDRFKRDWDQYLVENARIVELSRSNNSEQAQALNRNAQVLFDKLSNELLALANLNLTRSREASHQGDQTYASARVAIIAVLAVMVVLGLAFAVFVARNLRNQLGGEPAYAVDVVRRIADGDLGFEVEVAAGGTDSLLAAMQSMRSKLAVIVGDVRGGTDTIAAASQQIASGNIDLSARTEQQASALEETAASMEELTSTVRQNADNARQANRLALSASEVAVRGGTVVADVVGTMDEINASSRKIAEITGVIDSIAFQTNILALNAAVEAARAGEQGRGFAVVASEVRNLAQRSATAARDIKQLIGDSVDKVGAGTVLVGTAGATMRDVVTSIQQVADMMSEITAASVEQSAGIEQVNQAVTQMDQVTQQNAALVEEAAAAAESMREQARHLSRAIGIFKLGADRPAVAAGTGPARLALAG
ncbi:methyl-accepting chemotaxis protein [Duganella sp. Leaf126]|uniref:methyl-accepting chemotaxis protein n=1 Tax=Duganella sp. Leaf126 TaxID=1736266 RepID=UPI0035A68CBA